jgi:hypothetical protein
VRGTGASAVSFEKERVEYALALLDESKARTRHQYDPTGRSFGGVAELFAVV